MARQFEYDESGSSTLYVVLSVLILYLVPATLSRLSALVWGSSSSTDAATDPLEGPNTCHCAPCTKKNAGRKKKKKASARNVWNYVYVGALVAFVVVVYLVSHQEAEQVYDPFEVLGISSGATDRQIKKRYRELSLKFHPDRNSEPGAAERFIRITKAYDALTDRVTRENWEKYGNPDGPTVARFGMALPQWLVAEDNTKLVLGMYLLGAVGLVLLVRWYSNTIKSAKEEVSNMTIRLYYYFTSMNPTPCKGIVERLSLAEEFSTLPVNPGDHADMSLICNEVEELPKGVSDVKKFKLACRTPTLTHALGAVKARVLLHGHLARMHDRLVPTTLADLSSILERMPFLMQNMISVAAMRAQRERNGPANLVRTVLSIMRVSQQLVQAVSRYTKDSPFLQIPHFTAREAAYCLGRKTRIHSIRDFIKQPDDKIRSILRSFTPEQLNDVAAFNATFPLLQIDTSFEIKDGTINSEGNSIITPGSLVTVTITLRRQRFEEVRAETELALVEAEEKTEVLDEDKAIAKYLGKKQGKKKGKSSKGGKTKSKKSKKEAEAGPAAASAGSEAGAASSKPASAAGKEGDDEQVEKIKVVAATAADFSGSGSDDSDDDEESEAEAEAEEEEEEEGEYEDLNDDQWELLQRNVKKPQRSSGTDDDAQDSPLVHCPFYPHEKQEWWWVFICDKKDQILQGNIMKVTNLRDERDVEMQIVAPDRPGSFGVTVHVISDSYMGADIIQDYRIDVQEADIDRSLPPAEPRLQEESADELTHSESEGDSD